MTNVVLKRPPRPGEKRAPGRIRAHYEIERELADRLRAASADERRALYTLAYDELFRRVPDHPQLTRPRDAGARAAHVGLQLRMLAPYLTPTTTFLEIGAGDCALSIAVAARVRSAIAIDVSETVSGQHALPPNVQLRITDGTRIPVEPGSITLAYSNQLMEHLHPDDARAQLRNVHTALAPGGRYLCVTPHPFLGPNDVSYYFDDVATGFHLREYTVSELSSAFRDAGFSSRRALVGSPGRTFELPVGVVRAVESGLAMCPAGLRRALASRLPFRALFSHRMVGRR